MIDTLHPPQSFSNHMEIGARWRVHTFDEVPKLLRGLQVISTYVRSLGIGYIDVSFLFRSVSIRLNSKVTSKLFAAARFVSIAITRAFYHTVVRYVLTSAS